MLPAMKTCLKYNLILGLLCGFALQTMAQANKKTSMQRAPANVNVDGKLTEWGDSLAMYDSKSKLNYTIANDDSNLYVVAYATDRMLRHKIMAGGITIAVNSEGKKHKTFNMTYPVPDKMALMSHRNEEEDPEQVQRPSLIESTTIRVSGFKDVESDVITTNNTYGFKASISFDDKHNLVYETAIPLKMLYLKHGKNNDLAINISINGVERPSGGPAQRRGGMEGGGIGGGGGMSGGGGMGGGGGRRGGRGGNRGGGGQQQQPDRSGMSESTDFWVDLALAQH